MTSENMTSLRQRYAQFIVRERLRRNFSQVELARRAGLLPQYVSDYENGARNVRLDNLEKLLVAVGVLDETGAFPLRERLAKNLLKFRESQGYSQEGLAAKAGVHRTYVSMLERNLRNASLDHVECLARALRISGEALLGLPELSKEE